MKNENQFDMIFRPSIKTKTEGAYVSVHVAFSLYVVSVLFCHNWYFALDRLLQRYESLCRYHSRNILQLVVE